MIFSQARATILYIFFSSGRARLHGGIMNIGIIIDIVVVALVLVMTIVGIKRGFVKTIMGLATSVLVIVIAILAVTPLTNAIVEGTELDDMLNAELEKPLSEKLPNAYAKVYYYDTDGDDVKELVYEIDSERHPYDEIMGSSLLKFVGNLAKPLVEDKVDMNDSESSVYFIDAITSSITGYVFLVGMFIVLLIVVRLLMAILMKLLKKAVSRLYIAHFLDKVLGGVFGLAVGALIVFVVLTILQILAPMEFMSVVNAELAKTTLVSFIMDNNFLYSFIAEKIDVSGLLGNIGK